MKVKDINNKNKIENEYFKINKDKTIFPELLLKQNLKNIDIILQKKIAPTPTHPRMLSNILSILKMISEIKCISKN